MSEDNRMPNFWWCPTHHLYRGGDQRPCADAVRLVPEAGGDTDLVTADPRIREIRAVLARWQQYRAMPIKTLPEWSMAESLFANIAEILDSAPPATRTWFPGDTVPAGTALMLEDTEGTNP